MPRIALDPVEWVDPVKITGVKPAVRARLLLAKRNAAMHRWVVANDKRLVPRIHYAPGYVPVG